MTTPTQATELAAKLQRHADEPGYMLQGEDAERGAVMLRALASRLAEGPAVALPLTCRNSNRSDCALFRTSAALAAPQARDERAEFEAYCRTRLLTLVKWDDGEYLFGSTVEAWESWQAARASLPASEPVLLTEDEAREVYSAVIHLPCLGLSPHISRYAEAIQRAVLAKNARKGEA